MHSLAIAIIAASTLFKLRFLKHNNTQSSYQNKFASEIQKHLSQE